MKHEIQETCVHLEHCCMLHALPVVRIANQYTCCSVSSFIGILSSEVHKYIYKYLILILPIRVMHHCHQRALLPTLFLFYFFFLQMPLITDLKKGRRKKSRNFNKNSQVTDWNAKYQGIYSKLLQVQMIYEVFFVDDINSKHGQGTFLRLYL